MSDIITVKNLSKSFGKKKILENISFTLPAGKITGLLGENGIGKTTLLRIMAGFLRPDSGSILINGQETSQISKCMVSYLMEPVNFYDFMRVKDAIQYYKDFFPDFDYAKAAGLCEESGLDVKQPIRTLSKGNKERLCLMLALSRKVPLYLLDEPIAGFDPRFKRDLISKILSYMDEGSTLIISSHLLRDLESAFDDILILKKNSITAAGADEIRAQNMSVEDYYMEVTASD